MKNSTFIISFILVLASQPILGQNKFAFYKNSNLYISSTEGETSLLGADIKIRQNKQFISSKRYTYRTMPTNVLNNMKISDGMEFYSALQSLDGNTWLYVERNTENASYNLCLYDNEKNKDIIFSEDNSPDPNYAFMPIAWSSSKDVVYLEALFFGSAAENEGIWSYNIATQQFTKLSISPSYLTTPVISPDGEYFIYGGTTDVHKNLHSALNIVFIYDIGSNNEKIIAKDNNTWFSISGWVANNINETDLISIDEDDFSLEKKGNTSSQIMQPAFELPWNSGVRYYVSRAGTPAPSGGAVPSCYLNYGFAPHTYIALDFDSPNGVYDPVRASAAGTVVYAQFNSSGYGNLVKIRHSDNTITYYAHLNTISVNVNDNVQQGCEIGDGGTTGESTGDHIHFEWRDVGEAKFTSTYPTFGECGCQPHPNYCYTSNNVAGNCVAGTKINAPSNVVALVNGTTVNLSWRDNSTTEQGFKIERKTGVSGTWAQITTVGANVTSYANTSLTTNQTYYYRVLAYSGSTNSNPSNEYYAYVMASPSGLTATTISSSQINLRWTDNTTLEMGYKIDRKTGATGAWAELATVNANATTYSNTGLAASTQYYYRVRAYANSTTTTPHYSSYSNEANAITNGAPVAAPSNLVALANGTTVNLTWRDNSTNEQGFKIERKTGASGVWAQITTVGSNVTSYANSGLATNQIYYYRLLAYSGATNSGYSNEYYAYVMATPSGLTATAVSSSQINLSWMDNTPYETGYKIDRKTGISGAWSQIATVGANTRSFSNTGLLSRTQYYYRVRAYANSTTSTPHHSFYSNEATTITRSFQAIVLTSLQDSARLVAGGQHKIMWQQAGIKSVRLEYSTDNGNNWNMIADNVSAGKETILLAKQAEAIRSLLASNAFDTVSVFAGSYPWIIPHNPCQQLELRISSIESDGLAISTSVEVAIDVPTSFRLLQNFPNPFNPQTEIGYHLPQESRVVLTIFNTLGQPVRTLINEQQPPGIHTVIWDAKNEAGESVSSGMYFYRLKAREFQATRKAMVVR